MRMNVNKPPFDNQEVRNAVQLAVDNATVLDLGYQGLGTVAENHHVGPMHPEYAELPPIARDPEKAMAMLTEAGQADFEFELISLDDDFDRNTCDAVAAQMRDAGHEREAHGAAGQHLLEQLDRLSVLGDRVEHAPARRAGLCAGLPQRRAWNETGFSDPRASTSCSTRPARSPTPTSGAS